MLSPATPMPFRATLFAYEELRAPMLQGMTKDQIVALASLLFEYAPTRDYMLNFMMLGELLALQAMDPRLVRIIDRACILFLHAPRAQAMRDLLEAQEEYGGALSGN